MVFDYNSLSLFLFPQHACYAATRQLVWKATVTEEQWQELQRAASSCICSLITMHTKGQ